MKKINFINLDEKTSLETIIKDILINHDIEYDSEKIIRFSLLENQVEEIFMEDQTTSLFDNVKIILIKDFDLFYNQKSKNIDENEQKKMVDFFLNYKGDNIFILVDNSKLVIKKNIASSDKINYLNFSDLNNKELEKKVIEIIKKSNLNIRLDAKEELIKRVELDFIRLEKEILKLSLLNREVLLEDVINLVSIKLEDNVFNLIDYLMEGNYKKTFFLYKDLIKGGMEIVPLNYILYSQFKFLYDVKHLVNQNKNNGEIASLLNAHPYRVSISSKKLYMISINQIEKIIKIIIGIEKDIKIKNIDRFLTFENGLLNIIEVLGNRK